MKDRGWQLAVESIFPFKLDRVQVVDGSLRYLSLTTAAKPLQLTRLSMLASNVRNITAINGTYQSPVSLEADLFETGKVRFKGRADFLREPYVAAQGEIHLEHVPLDRLAPLAQNYQLKTTGGFLSVNGSTEFTPEAQKAHLTEVLIEDLRVDYITSTATRTLEMEHAKQALQLAKKVRSAPHLLLQVDALRLTNSQIGFVNEIAQPPYRLFISEVSLALDNLSNHGDQPRSTFKAKGAFMGNGTTTLSGGAMAAATPADFNVQLRLENARLPDLNGFLLAHTGVDVAEGTVSVYSELTVRNGRIDGYLKPLVKHLKIYDRQKDKGKAFSNRVKMHLLQFMAGVFRNRATQDVATVIPISGSTSDSKGNGWAAMRKLISHGFLHAILPGFLDKPMLVRPSNAIKTSKPEPVSGP